MSRVLFNFNILAILYSPFCTFISLFGIKLFVRLSIPLPRSDINMVAQGQGNQGQSGQNGSGSQNNGGPSGSNKGQDATTITSSQRQPTTTLNPFSQTITASPTSTSTTLTSSSTTLTKVIMEAVIGGVGALLLISLLISLLAIWLLQRRKKRTVALENNTTQPVTYAALNSVFSGVPFRNSQTQQALLHNSTQRGSAHSSNSDAGLRSGAAGSPPMLSVAETDLFLPSYVESQAAASIHQYSPTVSNISPMSSRAPNSLHAPISPQTIGTQSMRTPVLRRDTMGFLFERHDFEMMRLEQATPNAPVLIVAPIPRHYLVQHDSLESVFREGMVPSLSPALTLVSNASTVIPHPHSHPNPTSNPVFHSSINPTSRASSVMSEATNFESPVLGDPNRRRFQTPPAANHLNMSSALGLTRNESQRTVSTVSSLGISIISDGELDRLGVGARAGAVPMPMPARYH